MRIPGADRRRREPGWIALGSAIAASLVWVTGCGKDAPPKVMAAEEVPPSLQAAFKEASTEAKNAAEEAVTAIQAKDEPKAFVELNGLMGREDLTAQQRETASRAMAAMAQQLQDAAAQGNQQAEQLLDTYRARK